MLGKPLFSDRSNKAVCSIPSCETWSAPILFNLVVCSLFKVSTSQGLNGKWHPSDWLVWKKKIKFALQGKKKQWLLISDFISPQESCMRNVGQMGFSSHFCWSMCLPVEVLQLFPLFIHSFPLNGSIQKMKRSKCQQEAGRFLLGMSWAQSPRITCDPWTKTLTAGGHIKKFSSWN